LSTKYYILDIYLKLHFFVLSETMAILFPLENRIVDGVRHTCIYSLCFGELYLRCNITKAGTSKKDVW